MGASNPVNSLLVTIYSFAKTWDVILENNTSVFIAEPRKRFLHNSYFGFPRFSRCGSCIAMVIITQGSED